MAATQIDWNSLQNATPGPAGAWTREGRSRSGEAETFFYDGVAAGREVRAGLSRRSAATRPLPMEEICFFVKSIDNSRLIRVVDPGSRRECFGLIAFLGAVFCLALFYVGPDLAMLRTGYRIEDLKRQHEAMVESNRRLQVSEAALRNPQRIYSIARRNLGLNDPGPEQVVWPEGNSAEPGGSELLAHNTSQTKGR